MKYNYSPSYCPPALYLPVSVTGVGREITKVIDAQIDTGSPRCGIPENLRDDLGILPVTHVNVKGAFDKVPEARPLCYINIKFEDEFSVDVKAYCLPAGHPVIVGRDILNLVFLFAAGPDQIFELCETIEQIKLFNIN